MQSQSNSNTSERATPQLPLVHLAQAYGKCVPDWHFIPLHSVRPDGSCTCERGAGCPSKGKHPRLTDWPEQASNDPATLADWEARWPERNLGLATGSVSGVFVLDVDPKNGGDLELGKLERLHGRLPPTLLAKTPSGGFHYFFQMPAHAVSNAKAATGLDIRGDGGQVVLSPSKTAHGKYAWAKGREPWNMVPAPAPGWLLARLNRLPAERPAPTEKGRFPPATPPVLAEARKALAAHGPAVEGQGGDGHTVHAAALLTHDFALSPDEAWSLLVEWNATCVPPWDEDELRVKLANGARYGKLPYGCRRTVDTRERAEMLIRDWQDSGASEAAVPAMVERVRELRFTDTVTRELVVKALQAATGLKQAVLNLPPAVDAEALAERDARLKAYALGSAEFIDPTAVTEHAG